ncbi:MAG: hypothetical protein CW338_02955 [Clostridiales bacterium]|nr:hypothetical protein [Clostridiales bacterium]
MAGRPRETRVCDICGAEKECTKAIFFPKNGGVKIKSGTTGLYVKDEFPLYACDDCGREKGKNASGLYWLFILLGYAVAAASIPYFIYKINNTPSYDFDYWSVIGPIAVLVTGWMMSFISALQLIQKVFCEEDVSKGTQILMALPVANIIYPLARMRQINRCCRAATALLPAAEDKAKQLGEEHDAKAAEIERIRNKEEPLTYEEKLLLAEEKKKEETARRVQEAAKAEAEEQAAKSNYTSSIISFLFTICFAIYGLYVYSNEGYFIFFNKYEISGAAFAVIIVVFLIFDIITLVRAVKRKNGD